MEKNVTDKTNKIRFLKIAVIIMHKTKVKKYTLVDLKFNNETISDALLLFEGLSG